MNCPKCGGENVEMFMAEPIECAHCEKITYIEYYRCSDCEIVFKAVGDKVIDDSIMDVPSEMLSVLNDLVSAMFSGEATMMDEDEFKEVIEEMGEDLEIKEIKVGKTGGMSDLVHRCLNCNEVAYEESEGNYKCPKCGFSWEVVNCG